MSHHPHHSDIDDTGEDVRSALATLVTQEPDLPTGSADIERRGRRRLAARRLGGGVAAAVLLATAGVTAVNLVTSDPAGPDQIAQPPDVTAPVDSSDPAGGSTLANGFPVGSAVDAVARALPGGIGLAELPMDMSWRAGGQLDVPIVVGPVTGEPADPTHLVTIQIVDGTCSATVEPAGALSDADLEAIATSVCAEWVASGSQAVIPADPSGEEQPDLAAQ